MKLKGTKTHNLKAAFAGESQANRVLYFANKTDVKPGRVAAVAGRPQRATSTRTAIWTTSRGR
jgi:rubrerythrin